MQVKVYTKNDDPYSQMVKSLLQYYHVSFMNLEVSRDQEVLQEMIKISGQSSTPVLVIGDKVYCGFDRELIKEVLEVEKERQMQVNKQEQKENADNEQKSIKE
jgi:glutaredoxin